MNNLLLTIASWLLPEGYRIILPGTEIIAPLDPEQTRFIVLTEGRYLREGRNHYYCPRHEWQFVAGSHEEPQCQQCRGEAFVKATKARDVVNPTKREVTITDVMKQRFVEERLGRERR